ncbi:MAG: four helix bundle protein, partial [Cyclobacteriaceae bacterium]
RASRSVTANIAEGHGRFHFQENTQFCRQARGSLVEIFDQLTVARDEGFIDESQFKSFFDKYEQLMKMLNGYIAYLQKRKK